MNQEGGGDRPAPTSERFGNEGARHPSTRGLIIGLAGIAAALVFGYLLLNKLVEMSQEEDCALAHRYNCGAIEMPR
ncbi:hypothetical protein [Bradyrhizobium sp.]|uniref:hypothetical protein n=1 Tax=Bradyrhizobium sp. TaxID=376 RepID=UPI002383A8B9|nr:hypothetical protein [Bradyrhizobium sp.]MDE1935916.1 hypothetical protein [Bradyrhizobium sp.]